MHSIFRIHMSPSQHNLFDKIPKSREKFWLRWSRSLDTRTVYARVLQIFSPLPLFPCAATRFLKSDRIFRGRGAVVHGPGTGWNSTTLLPAEKGPAGWFFLERSWAPFYSCRPNSKRAIGARTTMECSSACGAARSDPLSLPSLSPPPCLRSSRTSWTVGRSPTSPW